jgi:hypothetical protein
MERHAHSHKEGQIIKTYKLKGCNKIRPEEHLWNETTRKYFPGPGAILNSIVLPEEMYDKEEGDLLRCRKCQRKTAVYSEDMALRSKSAILTKLLKHEDMCVSAPKKKQKH